ncbi:hypothetical protein [Lignipirellula cremea]|uniref:Uncharacterized protein n=1 Tax=Lignipirellula cremea TaxID=2528010 RepID=A0A518DZJ1_9BACT|nr:hypothetical protein [Lignipirellula cremea]QDU97258.1 hypothetical protein Pla8534_51030 [Lignipirellula cremea]
MKKTLSFLAMFVALLATAPAMAAAPVVPGTGVKVDKVGDDFEDPEWQFFPNGPKSSYDIDENRRSPTGTSKNGRWYEGIKRGYPDIVRRVETPKRGLAGSKGALAMRSLQTGIPGAPSGQLHQDDYICNIHQRIGMVPVNQSPNCVVRVFLPPIDTWENRTGPSFGFRLALTTTAYKSGQGFLGLGSGYEEETYWPGMFINLESKTDRGREYDSAFISVRGAKNGADFRSKPIEVTGWWTFGMSVTPDGMVHYYAKPGVEDLTAKDYITSQYPYGYRAEKFKTFFFNVCNGDNGRDWSTEWIVDDPTMYLVR